MDIPHQQVNPELAQHGNIQLDINRVRVQIASDLCRREQAAGLGVTHNPRLRLNHVDGVLTILRTNAGDEANVRLEVFSQSDSVSSGNLVGVLIVKVDQVQRNLPPLLFVALQQRGLRKATGGKVELPANIPGIVHRRVHTLRSLGRVGVAGITGQEGPGVRVLEAVRNSLADLVPTKPLNVFPLDTEGRHDLLGALHDKVLTENVPVTLSAALQFNV